MSINVLTTVPGNNTIGHYLDHSIFVEFDVQLESSYLDVEFFKVYRTNETKSEFYELLSCILSIDGNIVQINPEANLEPLSYYMLIIIGGVSGIRGIGNESLATNYIFSFKTSESVSPDIGGPEIIPIVGIHPGDTSSTNYFGPSHNVFSKTGHTSPISFLNSYPSNRSVGINNFNKLILNYNDIIDTNISIPVNSLEGRWNNLPFDLDPFGDRSIPITNVSINGKQIVFNITPISDTLNKEYIFSFMSGIVRGVNRQGYNTDILTVKFMGPLSPVYATPDQIHSRLGAWNVDIPQSANSYEIWKLILEVSLWVKDVYGAEMNENNMSEVNALTICLVLREILLRGQLFSGGIKSRALLGVAVHYESMNWDAIKDQLDECIRSSIPEDSQISYVMSGIKSGTPLSQIRISNTKLYGIYR